MQDEVKNNFFIKNENLSVLDYLLTIFYFLLQSFLVISLFTDLNLMTIINVILLTLASLVFDIYYYQKHKKIEVSNHILLTVIAFLSYNVFFHQYNKITFNYTGLNSYISCLTITSLVFMVIYIINRIVDDIIKHSWSYHIRVFILLFPLFCYPYFISLLKPI